MFKTTQRFDAQLVSLSTTLRARFSNNVLMVYRAGLLGLVSAIRPREICSATAV